MAKKRVSNAAAKPDKPKKPERVKATAAVRAECYAEYSDLMAQRNRINSDMAALFEEYEAKGIDAVEKKAIKAAYAVVNNKDQPKVKLQHRTNTEVLIAVGALTVADADWTKRATQAELADLVPGGEAADKLASAKSYNDGYNTALAGGLITACRHKPGEEVFVRWRDGWSDGNEDRIKKNPEKANEKAADTRTSRTAPTMPEGVAGTA